MATDPPASAAGDPGRSLGTAGLILAIIPFTYAIGLALSVVAWVQSNRVGITNHRAVVGMIIGGLYLGLSILAQITGVFARQFG